MTGMKWKYVFTACTMIATAAGILSCQSETENYSPEVSRILGELDRTLEEKNLYEELKNDRIRKIKDGHSGSEYEIYDRLYDEYYQYNIDSAIMYARKKQEIAILAGNDSLLNDARLDIADRYVLSGMFEEAMSIMKGISPGRLDEMLRPRYYHIYNSLYNGMCAASDDPVLREKYRKERDRYRQILYEKLGDDDISKLYVLSEIMIDAGKPDKILDSLYDRYNSLEISLHEKAILSYIIGNAWLECGNRDKAICHYAESAINDLKTPVNEYKSLHELAALLYEKGDVRRAYRYITRSVNDAMTANARINIQSINKLLPIISDSYNIQMRRNQKQLKEMLGGISILAVPLAPAAVTLMEIMKKVSVAERLSRE